MACAKSSDSDDEIADQMSENEAAGPSLASANEPEADITVNNRPCTNEIEASQDTPEGASAFPEPVLTELSADVKKTPADSFKKRARTLTLRIRNKKRDASADTVSPAKAKGMFNAKLN